LTVSIIRWHGANLPHARSARTFGFDTIDGAFRRPERGVADSVGSRGIA
jgi:hypothetical protein